MWGGGKPHLKMDQWESYRSTIAVPSSLSVREWLVGDRGKAKKRFRSDTQPEQAVKWEGEKTLSRAMHPRGTNCDAPNRIVNTHCSTTMGQAVSFSAGRCAWWALRGALQRQQEQSQKIKVMELLQREVHHRSLAKKKIL